LIKELFRIIEQYQTIIICGHLAPDCDSFGSSIGLRELLRTKYPEKRILSAGKGIPRFNLFIAMVDDIKERDIKDALLIMVDVSNIERIEDKRLLKAKEIIKIDHHIEDYPFDGFKVMQIGASSVCQMIAEIAIDYHLELSTVAATALFSGLVTDTGRFSYALDQRTFEVANFLMKKNINYLGLYDLIYKDDVRKLELIRDVYSHYQTTKAGLAYYIADLNRIKKLKYPADKIQEQVNLLSNVDGFKVWLFLSEVTSGVYRGEIRSSTIDVHQIAIKFRGGGHKNASGFSVSEDQIGSLLKIIDKTIIKSQKNQNKKELEAAITAAKLAQKAILEVYETAFTFESKSDDSPVTKADKRADEIIFNYLKSKFPTHGFLTEESEDDLSRLDKEFVWVVDPVDGTKDFIARNGEFATSIALVRNHEVVVGVVMAPVTGEYYYAVKDYGSFYVNGKVIRRIHVSKKTKNITVLLSNFHSKPEELALVERYQDVIKTTKKKGSCLKLCAIAKGEAELTYRLSGGTKEWDIAASVLIVSEAGGIFVEPDGQKIIFNRPDVHNHKGYIVTNSALNMLL
jgi:3'(2'), 5'-bisphosphate nucleotidase